MTDRLSQLQDRVNYLAGVFCDAIGVLQSQAKPSRFEGFADNIERGIEYQQDQNADNDLKKNYAELIITTAKEIDEFIDSLPDDDEFDEQRQLQELQRLEYENTVAAKELENVTNCAENLVKQIQDKLSQISESELKIHQTLKNDSK